MFTLIQLLQINLKERFANIYVTNAILYTPLHNIVYILHFVHRGIA